MRYTLFRGLHSNNIIIIITIYALLVNSNSIVHLYAYGTNGHTIRVRLYHMHIRTRTVCPVPYAYGMKYACGTQHSHLKSIRKNNQSAEGK